MKPIIATIRHLALQLRVTWHNFWWAGDFNGWGHWEPYWEIREGKIIEVWK